jgi:hypothetical protein
MNACLNGGPRLGDKAIGSWKLAGLVRNLGSGAEWNLRDHGVAGTTLFVYKLVVIILITLACNENLPRSHIFLIPIPVPYTQYQACGIQYLNSHTAAQKWNQDTACTDSMTGHFDYVSNSLTPLPSCAHLPRPQGTHNRSALLQQEMHSRTVSCFDNIGLPNCGSRKNAPQLHEHPTPTRRSASI